MRFVELAGPKFKTMSRFKSLMLVELAGFEPASKQGDHTLSTCLSELNFSSYIKTPTTKRNLIF